LLVEAEYWRLLQSGVGTVEACRCAGITRKTGYRWRFESGGLPPDRLAEDVRSTRYLSLLERQRIATLRERGHGVREIARRLGRSASTVSRELRRNLLIHDRNTYDGDLAHARARERARRVRRCRLAQDVALRDAVQTKLELEWSPEQIAAWLRETYPGQPSWHVCHETIYQALYHGGKAGLKGISPAGCGRVARCGSDAAEPTTGPPASSHRPGSSITAPRSLNCGSGSGTGKGTWCATRRCVTERR